MDIAPIVAVLLCLAAIGAVLLLLLCLSRRHRAMYAAIYGRDVAEVRARAAVRALSYDQTPVSSSPGDGSITTGAGAPDPAPVVTPHRVRVVVDGHGRHRQEAA